MFTDLSKDPFDNFILLDDQSGNKIIKTKEYFDIDKLDYIINNIHLFKSQMRWRERYDIIDPFKLIKKYLFNSRPTAKQGEGVTEVIYIQKKGKGRFQSKGSLSLQAICREFRHTIAKDKYIDIDIVNAHPVILQWMCEQNGFPTPFLNEYIKDRKVYLNKLINKSNNEINRDKAKQIYLALTNGGEKDYEELDYRTKHLKGYRKEMLDLHKLFSNIDHEGVEEVKKRRIKQNKDYNHEAAYMNTLMLDVENKILMVMYKFYDAPEDAVLCFDGLMIRRESGRSTEEDLSHNKKLPILNKIIFEKLGINVKVKIKSMDEDFKLPDKIPEYKGHLKLEYYTDFKYLAGKTVPEHFIKEWMDNSLKLIDNDGDQFFITKNKRIKIFSDKTREEFDEWKPIKLENIEKSLQIVCNVLNEKYDGDEARAIHSANINGSRSTKKYKVPYYKFTRLGKNKGKDKGYLEYIMENRLIDCYEKIDFYPYLRSKGEDPLTNTGSFNIFTGFPLENEKIELEDRFLNSHFYKHMLKYVCNNDKEEFHRLLEDWGDGIQDPSKIKGPSHVFYGEQGVGKGCIIYFLTKMVGYKHCYVCINIDTYFQKHNFDVLYCLYKFFEELAEKGKAFSNHNRLKGEQTSDSERAEPKGIDPFYVLHCAAYYYFTNNENSMFVEGSDRRGNFHKINNEMANNIKYFGPIWDELRDTKFQSSAFNYLANLKYNKEDVMTSYTTQYKFDQKLSNAPNGIKFLIDFIQNNYNECIDKDHKIQSTNFIKSYKDWCKREGVRNFHVGTMKNQIKKVGILEPRKFQVKKIRKYYFVINVLKIENNIRKYLYTNKKGFSFDFSVIETSDSEESSDDEE